MSDNYTPKTEWELQYEKEYKRILQAIIRQEKLGYSVPAEVKPTQPSKVKKITKTDVEQLMQITPKKIREQSVQRDNGLGAVSQHKVSQGVANITHKHRKSKQKVYSELPKQRKPKQNKQKEPTKPQTKTPENKQLDVTDTTQTGFTAPPKENNLNIQIIDDITTMLNQWQPEVYWTPSFHQRKLQNYYTISQIWAETLDNEGEYETAYRIELHAQEIRSLIEKLIYDSDSPLEDDMNLSRLISLLIGRALTAFEADYYTETAREIAIDSLRGENSIG